MSVDVILGLQWGDEGKGKIVDYLASSYDIVARFQGGPNAGHTLIFDNKKFVLHTIPSGIFRESLVNVIGNGVVIDPITLKREITMLEEAGVPYKDRLLFARKAHLILPTHRMLDAASEASKGASRIGSTLKGIGPTYMDKTGRNGLRVGDIVHAEFDTKYRALREKHLGLLQLYTDIDFDLDQEENAFFESLELLRSLKQVNAEYYINQALQAGKKILAEGAQGSMLDIDFGTYPYVTSSNTITAGVCTGLGISPRKIGRVIGITKAYCTRVGGGPFPTELDNEEGEFLRKEGREFGATTGRPRRCGWVDLPQLQYTIMLNGVTELVITKIDVLNNLPEIKAATSYQYGDYVGQEMPYDMDQENPEPVYQSFPGWMEPLDGVQDFNLLPRPAQAFVLELETRLGTRVSMVSTGPDRTQLIVRNS